jgi:hypothetical protein
LRRFVMPDDEEKLEDVFDVEDTADDEDTEPQGNTQDYASARRQEDDS